jgi:AraC-like DNA-binding protein
MPTLSEQLTETPEGMREWQQERLILDITERICELMEKSKVSRSELAARLGKSSPHLTQLLDGSANMTVRTVSDFFWALGRSAIVSDIAIGESVFPPVYFTWPQSKEHVPPQFYFTSITGVPTVQQLESQWAETPVRLPQLSLPAR